jgi:hypothetical protein
MELKVVCHCGQKYKFDVEPVNRQMPFTVNCPVCGLDGTPLANNLLMQMPMPATIAVPPPIPPAIAAPPPPTGVAPSLSISAPPVRSAPAAPAAAYAPAPAMPKYMRDNPAIQNNSFMLGVVGAILGAVVAVALMVGFTMFTGMRFPLIGTVMGAIIGFGARLMYRGTDSTLGFMSAGVAFVTIVGTFLLMFNIISILMSGVISLMVGVTMAWKVASG